jgi:poly(A) polymerase
VSEAFSDEALGVVRAALRDTTAWLVGGAPRDRLLSRETFDLDVIVTGSPADAARAIARAAGGAACFELSEQFAGWRVLARDRSWQVDVQQLRGNSIEDDLALRDFTVGAIAEPLQGGEALDPLGGLADLAARRLRMASPVAFTEDPLRALRLVRLALDLDFEADPGTARAARAAAPELARVSGERIFMELRRIVASPRALDGLSLMESLGITAAVLPELEALHGIQQSRYHHRDVHGHTLEVLERTIALQADPIAILGAGGCGDRDAHGENGEDAAAAAAAAERAEARALAGPVAALLQEPLADELTRGQALRWGALLHDAAKPLTAAVNAGGRGVTFLGHDVRGAELARSVLGRLRTSERLRAHVAALARHHLRLGFLVHAPQPLARRTVFDYLRATSPVEVDVTLLSIADRLATRGDRASESIDAHMRLARRMLADALRWRAGGPPAPLWRGDALAVELDIPTGPRIGALLAELSAAQYAGEIATADQALRHARRLVRAGAI